MQKTKTILVIALFISIVLIELGLQTIWLKELNIYTRPIVYLFFAISYLFFGYFFSTKNFNLSFSYNTTKPVIGYIHLLSLALILILFYLSWQEIDSIVSNNKIAPTNSDVIPSIQLYVKRMISGEKVYTILHFPGWDVAPTYLTMMWFPYIVAELLNIDYRLFSFLIFFLFILFIFFRDIYVNKHRFGTDLVAIFAGFMLWSLVKNDISVFAQTTELTIAVFYMILSFTIFSKNNLVIALGVLLCLLSRYSLSFWLVSYILIILISRGWRDFVIVNFYIIAGILLLFIPFIIDNLHIFIEGFKHYNKAAIGEWQVHSWQGQGDEPYQLSRGFGFAIYFYKLAGGEPVESLKVLQKSHLIISFVSGLFIAFLYYFNKSEIKNIRLYLMFGLKFFLMIFFVFIQVPYSYLFIVPLFLTIPILYELTKGF